MGFLSNLLGKKEKKIEEPKDILEEEKEENENKPEIINGTIAIEGGAITITPPGEGGSPAKIQPSPGAKVLVNGEGVMKSTPVLDTDIVEILLDSVPPVREIELNISNTQMEAYLEITLKKGREVFLKDSPPTNYLVVATETKDVDPLPVTTQELRDLVEEKGVFFGIDEEALEKATSSTEGSVVIATGKDHKPGTDAYIEKCYEEADNIIPSVEEGELVLIKHLAVPGEDGMTITGRVINAPPVKDCELKVEGGLVISEDGLSVHATESGRPMEKKGVFFIDPVYTINGDVSVAKDKGHLIFKGHLIISGSVQEGMKLETGGDLQVNGGVLSSEILSGGTVRVQKSLIASNISSGRFKLVLESVAIKLNRLTKDCKSLLDTALQLKSKAVVSNSKDIAEDKIIKVLLSSRFPNFISVLNGALEEVNPINKNLAGELQENFVKLGYFQSHIPEKINDLPNLYNLLNQTVMDLKNYSDSSSGEIYGYYMQNSHLEASGGVYIKGMGCYNTIIISRGEVRIEGNPGIFRGGKIVAGENVYVRELGCPSGAPTTVEVEADKKVEAEHIHAGVVLKVGDKIYRNYAEAKNFDIFLDREGNLQVTSLKGNLNKGETTEVKG